MQYPADDADFQERSIDSVTLGTDGTYSITCDGWTLWCGKQCDIKPEVGHTARQYGGGIGYTVRGLFINGHKVWYRSASEEAEYSEIQRYGADAKDWLTRWDEGRTVWSIEMGGLGPSYEQCIHIACAEMLRWFLDNKCDSSKWDDPDAWRADEERAQKALMANHGVVQRLSLSGAQWGAALCLASQLYRHGPRAVMTDEQVKNRHIQICKHFPSQDIA